MQIQSLNISNISADNVTIELQISDQPELEDSAEYLVVSVNLPNPDQARNLGKMQLDALKEAQQLIKQAADEIERELVR